VEDLQALIEAAGGSACLYGFSSGAVLALRAAADGLPIDRLALMEPPLDLDNTVPPDTDLGAEIVELVAAGSRGDAVEPFNRSIGVSEEMIAGLRQAPFWPALEGLARTLVYDTVITSSALAPAQLPAIRTPTLVLASAGSDERLLGWAQGVADALPNGSLRTMKGEWHGVPAEDLAPVLREFFGEPHR
jgi:hypothetical protein